MENVQWEDLKANGKIEMDLRDITCDVDKLIASDLKLCQLPQNV
jgi:hypothetical protein